LREIAEKNIVFLSAERLNNGIKMSKNKAREIEDVSKRWKDFIYLIFDIGGNIIRIKANIEIDKDTGKYYTSKYFEVEIWTMMTTSHIFFSYHAGWKFYWKIWNL